MSYVVTGKVVSSRNIIGIKVYDLSTLEPKFLFRKDFDNFFSSNDVSNVSYVRGRLVSENECIPICFLRTFSEDGFIISDGVRSESVILAAYSELNANSMCVRLCRSLVSDSNPDNMDMNADLYYCEIRGNAINTGVVCKRTGFSIKDILTFINYVFMPVYTYINMEWCRIIPDFAIAQSWQRLSDETMEIKAQDITLVNHILLKKSLEDKGYSVSEAHLEANRVYNYRKELEAFYNDKNKKH